MTDRLRLRVMDPDTSVVAWQEIEANHVNVGANGVIIFTWRATSNGMIQGPGGVAMPGMVVEERIVLIAQAEGGVLIPMALPATEDADVVQLAPRA